MHNDRHIIFNVFTFIQYNLWTTNINNIHPNPIHFHLHILSPLCQFGDSDTYQELFYAVESKSVQHFFEIRSERPERRSIL